MRRANASALIVTSALSLVTALRVEAASVAVAHPSLWPAPLDSAQGFDRASRADLLVYAAALDDVASMGSEELQTALELKTIDVAQVARWLSNERSRIVLNYERAATQCRHKDWTCVPKATTFAAIATAGRALPAEVPVKFAAWHQDLVTFSRTFALEQLRLAAVFPAGGNETDLFNNIEWTGETLPDRTFALTFDDGPTASGGTTDQTLALLKKLNKSAAFFLLGIRLEKRVADERAAAVASLYESQCVASHGWVHHSHATWDDWQGSVTRMKALLSATFQPTSVLSLFRPPNGQRRADSGAFFASESLHVALWNIDAYDWNRTMDGDAVAGRVTTLILIRRHGVILFHDIYGNALSALPTIFGRLGQVIDWPDCHELSRL
jgi:peptidoglycan/xylan/chitin deacetylase (PgdA/CDA1 family)